MDSSLPVLRDPLLDSAGRTSLAVASRGVGDDSDANETAWSAYGDIPLDAFVRIPVHEMLSGDLMRLAPGTMLQSSCLANDDVGLYIKDVFLANVALEPVDEYLGIRINNFSADAQAVAQRGKTNGRQTKYGRMDHIQMQTADAIRVAVSLCFGTKRLFLQDALKLTQGDLLLLDRGLRDPVTVMVNHRVIALGSLMLVGGCYAVKILDRTGGATPAQPKLS